MNSFYETWLRNEIFVSHPEYADEICRVWEDDPTERQYIECVIEDYINGGSVYQAYKRLKTWVIDKQGRLHRKIDKKFGYLEDEFKGKLK